MSDDGGSASSQIELKKLLASILSNEARRAVEGLLDGSIILTVATALEMIRIYIYTPAEKEYMTRWALRFDGAPVVVIEVPDVKTGELIRVAVPVKISESKVFRDELVRLITEQSVGVWVTEFRDSISFTAAASVNRQPESKHRRKSSLEDLL